MRPGKTNSLLDIAGISVGNAHDEKLKSGVTTILCDQQFVASAQVLGGAPGTRDVALLEPHQAVEAIDAIVLSGGSAFGLDAASGVQAWLREQGRGLKVGPVRVPIVPGAIIFDLTNGGDKNWGRYPPYRDLAYAAAGSSGDPLTLGSVGAGAGALVAGLKGGLGSASTILPNGVTIACLAVANALGAVNVGSSKHFWAAPFELGDEFGGLGMPIPMPPDATDLKIKFRDYQAAGANTTIAVVATDAALTKAQCKRLAIAAHDGFTRAIWPSHTPLDGDIVFALASGSSQTSINTDAWLDLGATAASTMARAIARAVFEATPEDNDFYPDWKSRFR